jgi:hypothetical protein
MTEVIVYALLWGFIGGGLLFLVRHDPLFRI